MPVTEEHLRLAGSREGAGCRAAALAMRQAPWTMLQKADTMRQAVAPLPRLFLGPALTCAKLPCPSFFTIFSSSNLNSCITAGEEGGDVGSTSSPPAP